MDITDYIANRLNKFSKEDIFTYDDLTTDVDNKKAIIKGLNKLVNLGEIKELREGNFYIPKQSSFGYLQPEQKQITKNVINKLDRLPKGYIFTYNDFITNTDNKEAVIKSLNRLAASGKINKLSKGKFYKPEQTPFGYLQPEQKQIIKDLLEKDGKLLGYITGLSIYNTLGFTTQISNTIQIGRNEVRPALKRSFYKIAFVKQKNAITKDNIPLLQLLDIIRFIKKIPDTSVDTACKRLKVLLAELNSSKQQNIIRLSMKYPPATRALLGALLENLQVEISLNDLQNSLNPITTYKLSLNNNTLSTASNWNIL